jgi:hypothetical protein
MAWKPGFVHWNTDYAMFVECLAAPSPRYG